MIISATFSLILVAASTALVPSVSRIWALTPPPIMDDKRQVRQYFDTEGFNRWSKIYSERGDVNPIQMDIRSGHYQTTQSVLQWADDGDGIHGKSICDCGCGVGSLAIPLARLGAEVSAFDISSAMVYEAARRAKDLGVHAKFYTSDLESVTGKFDMVTCVDVAIHYPTEKMVEIVQHLCSLAEERVIISFAPKTWYYVLLKKFGEYFPGPAKTTDEEIVRVALSRAGFEVFRAKMTATNFYFSRLLEAKRV